MVLIAVWKIRDDDADAEPDSLMWADGSPATLHDYRKHQLDTHTTRIDLRGYIERRFFPEVIALVIYDCYAGWVVQGEGIETTPLELYDPSATDDQIDSALWTFPTIYRARIIRSPIT